MMIIGLNGKKRTDENQQATVAFCDTGTDAQ